MALGRFVLPIDLPALRYHAGGLLQLLGALLTVPAAVALMLLELAQAASFAGMAGGSWLLGRLARRGAAPTLGRREAMALTAAAYLLFAAVGAVGFLTVAAPVDAFFEAMSGFTTTGLTVMDVDELPRSLLFFRGYSQWVGGGGIIVLSLVVLAGPGSAGANLYSAEFGEKNLLGSVVATGRVVLVLYAGLTAFGFIALVLAGAGPFDGLVHALALVSTGGFSPFPASVGAYGAAPVAVVTMSFMALGATSLPLFYLAWRAGWRDGWQRLAGDAQLRALLTLVAAGGLVFFLLEGANPRAGLAALFHATSAITTTGFVVDDPQQWADETRLLATGLMVVGGSLGSTAGGLKLLRLLILLRMVHWAITRVLLPQEAKIPLKIQHAAVSPDEVRHTFALTTAYFGVVFVIALALTAAGVPLRDALFETTSALSTVGLSVGVTGPDLGAWAKLVLAAGMWAGRVEILAVFVLLHPRNWQPQ